MSGPPLHTLPGQIASGAAVIDHTHRIVRITPNLHGRPKIEASFDLFVFADIQDGKVCFGTKIRSIRELKRMQQVKFVYDALFLADENQQPVGQIEWVVRSFTTADDWKRKGQEAHSNWRREKIDKRRSERRQRRQNRQRMQNTQPVSRPAFA
ncbi:MAG TPA: hypothetical protein VG965_03045 [Patescibacteria group bacterium]|nr:hypothetical protein [Patescibacteria group bacterium]